MFSFLLSRLVEWACLGSTGAKLANYVHYNLSHPCMLLLLRLLWLRPAVCIQGCGWIHCMSTGLTLCLLLQGHTPLCFILIDLRLSIYGVVAISLPTKRALFSGLELLYSCRFYRCSTYIHTCMHTCIHAYMYCISISMYMIPYILSSISSGLLHCW